MQEANAQYRAGKFQEALELYQRVHKVDPQPKFLYNMAQCQRKLQKYRRALAQFRSYLEVKDNDRDGRVRP